MQPIWRRRWAACAVGIACSTVGLSGWSVEAAWPPVWLADRWSVVRVVSYPSDLAAILHTSEVEGSGFWLPNGDVVTCYHVVQNAHLWIDVQPYATPAYDVIHFHVAVADPAQDLAVLAPNAGWGGYTYWPVRLGNATGVGIGTPVAIEGHPWGGALAVQPGIYAGATRHALVNGYGLLYHMLAIRGQAAPGDSGGPVFGAGGAVIGIAEAAGGGWTFAVPVNALQYLGVDGPGW